MNRALKTLEFNKIIEQVSTFANSSIAKQIIRELKPSKDIEEIREWLSEVTDATSMILKKGTLRIGGLRDIRPYIQRVAVEGSLNLEELLNIADFLSTCKRARQYARSENKQDFFPILEPRFELVQELEDTEREIIRCIISDTQMSDDASITLRDIRREVKNTHEKVRMELNKIIHSTSYKTMLQDAVITIKSDRHCIPVKAEYKNQFSGMVHDQSSTGATVFIEPESVIILNNKIKELYFDEQQEINKILKRLSEMVNEDRDVLLSNLEVLTEIDVIFAKGEHSISINGIEPIFNVNKYMNIKKGRHPLIDASVVVPIDIYLGDEFTTLLITGPNTGGKTVALKTIGLFTLMGQAGLHISASDGSELAVFDNVFSDIGDEQSIEQSLSTFSSHMTNIISILDEVTDNSFVILDELGAGTDPTEGACLAISIIQYLHDRGIRTAVTTHYSELKVFAISAEGVSNASCEFDIKTLRPTYRLLIGVPGKSNAFAISQRLGLSEHIINEAKSLISQEDAKFEDVITDLEINKKSLILEKERAESYRKEAQRLKDDVQSQKRKTKEQTDKIIFKATEEAKRILAQAKIDSDTVLKEIQKLAREKANQNAINIEKQKLKDKLAQIDDKLDKFANKTVKRVQPKNLKKGDKVFIHSLKQSGVVTSEPTPKGEFMIKVGILNIKTSLKDVSLDTTKPIKPHRHQHKQVTFKNNKSSSISYEIDLRGFYVEEAVGKVDKFIDDAFLAGMDKISIIHGKGTGALKTGIHDYLRRNKRVETYRLGEIGEGDAGVTIASLK